MKAITTILLMLFSVISMAQVHTNKNSVPPVFIIDSVKANKAYFDYMNPNNINDLKVFRNEQYPDGVIYLTSKNYDEMAKLLQSPLVSLNDIAKANVSLADKTKPILFILDDKLLTDTVAVRIPAIRVLKVIVIKAAETPYFKTALPNALLLRIATKPPELYIRGAATTQLKP